MIRFFTGIALSAALLIADSEIKVKLQDMPPAVQKAAQEQLRTATLVGFNKEVEKGKTFYEVETKVNGRSRDVLLDQTGAVVSVEEEIDLGAIPAPAREALRKKAAGGTITKVEAVTEGSVVAYEAAMVKNGKHFEAAVNADGSPHKE